ncbi:hypothetical protein SAMN05421780_102367 [Flexibacter flexilis DSM 6793]|uniref:Uncharacterized protein n=1 Tax=Flexibacter flexilis DSM 6793 TaxID=927664 RepID=A0A1I1FXJ1_9BACT|nr:hypothetical protein [Flexibacter flexilis]SFC04177.1 hypothetical protein SAMN05421780_102367 [Flexibacter flexilis DSM 6793]
MVATETNVLEKAMIVLENASACALYLPEYSAIVCVVKREFIIRSDFRALFETVGAAARIYLPNKIIFDMRKMEVFDQKIMTWYHTEWKPRLFKEIGLKKYRKLLPQNKLFRKYVAMNREQLAKQHAFDFSVFDIRHCETMEQALEF